MSIDSPPDMGRMAETRRKIRRAVVNLFWWNVGHTFHCMAHECNLHYGYAARYAARYARTEGVEFTADRRSNTLKGESSEIRFIPLARSHSTTA